MQALPLLFSLFATACLVAQGSQREVTPGREFHESKVLTPGQTDVWQLDVVADEVLRCRVTANDLDPVLELVDGDGNLLARNDGKGSQSYLQFRVEHAGDVSFRVRGFQNAGGGRYELFLERYVAPSVAVGIKARTQVLSTNCTRLPAVTSRK